MPPAPPHRRRRRRQSTAATLLTLALVVVILVLQRSQPVVSAQTSSTSRTAPASGEVGSSPSGSSSPSAATPASSSVTPGAGSEDEDGGSPLAATDPPHTAVQPFPAPGTCHARAEGTGTLPDPTCTPGAINPHVTQANLDSTICRRGGYTASIRPPVNITSREKEASMEAYDDTGSPQGYEFDHLVSLELGGSPNAPANLWPEPGNSPNPKDKIETRLHTLVCHRQITLAQAQQQIARDWVAAYTEQLGAAPARV